MFTTNFLILSAIQGTLPIVLVVLFPKLLGALSSKKDGAPAWRLRPAVRNLLSFLFLLVCWGLVGGKAWRMRNEQRFLQDLEGKDVKKIVYFENYTVRDSQQLESFVKVLNDLKPVDVGDAHKGVPFVIALQDGKELHWRAGKRPRSGEVWLETEQHQFLSSPELGKACDQAHFPF